MRGGSRILAFAGAMGAAVPARAEEPCAGVRVVSASDLSPAWAEAARALERQLPPFKRCAAMTMSIQPARGDGVWLLVMAEDGRHAERTVLQPAALAPTALGLVASIPPDVDLDAPRAGPAPSTALTPPLPVAPATAGVVAPAAERNLQVWLGVSAGARLGEPGDVPLIDFEGRADLVVNHWLLLAQVRFDIGIDGFDPPGDDYAETSFGLGVGRELSLGRGALDLAVVPSLVTLTAEDETSATEQDVSASELRIGASARWCTPLGDAWRFTVTADTDLAPRALDHPVRLLPTSAPAAAWTGGVRIGLSGAVL